MDTLEYIFRYIVRSVDHSSVEEFSTFAVIAIFFAIPYALGRFGKWKDIAKMYSSAAMRPDESFKDAKAAATHITIAGMYYNGGMIFIPESGGLYIKPNLLLKFTHPVVFIPWNEISVATQDKDGNLLSEKKVRRSGIYGYIQLHRTPDILVGLDEKTFSTILEKKKEFGF